MSKTPDIIKSIFDKKEVKKEIEKEEIIIAGVWLCGYCGTEFIQVIHPYYSNIPDLCINRQCVQNTLGNKRFIFIKWKIEKEKK